MIIAITSVTFCWSSNAATRMMAGGGFEEGRPEAGRGQHESATLEVRRSHAGTAAAGGGADVTASSAAVTVPFASSEDDRNLQTVSGSTIILVIIVITIVII